MLDQQIQELLEPYIAGRVSLADFSPRFASLYFAVRQSGNSRSLASQLCNVAIGPLAEHSGGHRSEDSLRDSIRQSLRELTRPTVPSATQ